MGLNSLQDSHFLNVLFWNLSVKFVSFPSLSPKTECDGDYLPADNSNDHLSHEHHQLCSRQLNLGASGSWLFLVELGLRDDFLFC